MVKITQNLTDQLVEVNETMVIELSAYFQGPLLEYQYDISDADSYYKKNKSELAPIISMNNPFKLVTNKPLYKPSFENFMDAFPRSTLLIEHNNGTILNLYLLDRNFYFQKFDVTHYASGNMTRIFSAPLNTSYVNDTCHDLMQITVQENNEQVFIIFCQSTIYDEEGYAQEVIYTVVSIEIDDSNDEEVPIFRYLQFNKTLIDFESNIGYQFIGYQNQTSFNNNNTLVLFVANPIPVQAFYYTQQILAKFNYSVFLDMKEIGMYQNFSYDITIIDAKSLIDYDERYAEIRAIDYKVVDYQNFILAVVMENAGVFLCYLSKMALEPQKFIFFKPTLKCDSNVTSQFISYPNAQAAYWNQQDPNVFFISMTSPPGVVEINIQDPLNAFVINQFSVSSNQTEMIGMQSMATSSGLIVHSIVNVLTNERVLRIYARNSTHLSQAKYQYHLPKDSRSNFFVFPNFYQNIMILRDERRINVTEFFDYKLTLNATNRTLIDQYKYNKYNVSLIVSNNYDTRSAYFFVTFVDQEFINVVASGRGLTEHNIFYNCGDNQFRYSLTDLFNGPNFNLQLKEKEDCKDGSCYFKIDNQNLSKSISSTYNFNGCETNFIYSDLEDLDDDTDPILLICVDKSSSKVTSYRLCTQCENITLTNEIEIPQIQFKYTAFDNDDRVFFIISQINYETTEFMDTDNEVHFFQVKNEVIWNGYNAGAIKIKNDLKMQLNLSDFQILSYNQIVNKGVMISYKTMQTEQLMLFFNISQNFQFYSFNVEAQKKIMVDNKNSTYMAEVSNDGFLFTLQSDKVLNIYQIILINGEYTFIILKSTPFDSDNKNLPHDFKIYDNYFIVYYEQNDIVIFEIRNKIDLVYKMKLPFYNEFSGFSFQKLLAPHYLDLDTDAIGVFSLYKIKQSYLGGFLSILMVNKNYHGAATTMIFTFQLFDSQHNSFVMTYDATSFYKTSRKYQDLLLIGNELHLSLTLISDEKIELYDAEFQNHLRITDDIRLRAQLFESCKDYKSDSQNASSTQIARLVIAGVSNIGNQSKEELDFPDNVTINVFTQNQGIAITPLDQMKQRNFTNCIWENSGTNNKSLLISLEEIIEGYNMYFEIYCSYKIYNGSTEYCNKTGIINKTSSIKSSFYIEFVTQQRQVWKAFSIDNLILMFDTFGMFTFSKLPRRQGTGDLMDGFPLQLLSNYLKEDEKLNCILNSYIGIQQVSTSLEGDLYLLMYQCDIDAINYLKLAQLRIFPNATNSFIGVNYQFEIVDDILRMPYKVIDIQNTKLVAVDGNDSIVRSTICLTLDIPESYSNLLLTYEVKLDLIQNKASFMLTSQFDSSKLKTKNSFKVTKLYSIPESSIVFVVDLLFGVYILDLEELRIIKEIDLWADNQFQDQNFKQIGVLQVQSIAGNLPYSIHVLSNYGIFIYNFKVNLQSREEIFENLNARQNLEPVSKKVIRYGLEIDNFELAQNDFGYAFLIKKQTSKLTNDVYLGLVSFYATTINSLFRMIPVASGNQDCHSLNIQNDLQTDQQDSIVVSFICNTLFFTVETSFKPYFSINMTDYKNSTILRNGNYISGAMQYNQFNVTIVAKNEYYKDGLNAGVVEILVSQKTSPVDDFPIVYLIGIIFTALISGLVIMLDYGCKTQSLKQQKRVAFYEQPKYSFDEKVGRMSDQLDGDLPLKDEQLLNLQEMNKIVVEESPKFELNILNQENQSKGTLQTHERTKFSIFNKKLTKKRLTVEFDVRNSTLEDNYSVGSTNKRSKRNQQ